MSRVDEVVAFQRLRRACTVDTVGRGKGDGVPETGGPDTGACGTTLVVHEDDVVGGTRVVVGGSDPAAGGVAVVGGHLGGLWGGLAGGGLLGVGVVAASRGGVFERGGESWLSRPWTRWGGRLQRGELDRGVGSRGLACRHVVDDVAVDVLVDGHGDLFVDDLRRSLVLVVDVLGGGAVVGRVVSLGEGRARWVVDTELLQGDGASEVDGQLLVERSEGARKREWRLLALAGRLVHADDVAVGACEAERVVLDGRDRVTVRVSADELAVVGKGRRSGERCGKGG